MKKILLFSSLAVLVISFSSSCKKATTNNPVSVTNSMSATINSIAWTAGTVTGTTNSGTLFISGINSGSGTGISMEMPSSTTAGTYTISNSSVNYVIGYSSSTSSSIMTAGTLVVSSNANNTISGTFNGTLTDPVSMGTSTVSNGTYTVKYQ